MNVLVTGGAGYIGSHAVKRLLADGHTVVALDNLMRGHAAAIERLGKEAGGRLHFARNDIGDRPIVEKLLKTHKVDCIMHFAALAAVGESVEQPLLYYRNNVANAIALLEAADAAGVQRFVFSSSCATYGVPPDSMVPIPEECPQNPISPYGWTKLHFEHVLRDYADACERAKKPFAYAALRYFNVAGSDRTGIIGEDHDPETHIIPVVLQNALGRRPDVKLFGNDYPTPDGTCIRDYVHVEDLIGAHVKVMHALKSGERRAYNVGIGKGYSVREIIDACRNVTKREIKVIEQPRRPGDPPKLYNNPRKINTELGWQADITKLEDIIDSAWRWFKDHPQGYKS